MNDLAYRLKSEREAKGWSQPELAAKSRVKQSFIGALEARNQQNSSWLPELAHALGVNAYWLKTGRGNRTGDEVKLSIEEQTIIDAFRMFGEEMRQSWLDVAHTRIEKESAVNGNDDHRKRA